MAGFLDELRGKLEKMREEIAPDAGFDRRAYGYEDGAPGEDATFEEAAGEDESPWRRTEGDPARVEPDAPVAGGTAGASGSGPAPGERARSPLVRRPAPSAATRGSPSPDSREQVRARGASRIRRLRGRLRRPESLGELFLLREVIDRPLALRGRPRGRSPS